MKNENQTIYPDNIYLPDGTCLSPVFIIQKGRKKRKPDYYHNGPTTTNYTGSQATQKLGRPTTETYTHTYNNHT